MKILLDECLPRKLKKELPPHECRTVPEAGLAGKKNGVLLSLAEERGFDVFLTIDKGLQYQQNLIGRKIAIIVLQAKSNRLADLKLKMPACLAILPSIQPGQVLRVG